MLTETNRNPHFIKLILIVSIVACLFLFWLIYFGPRTGGTSQFNYAILGLVNACLNGLATVALLFGFYFVRQGKMIAHRNAMVTAFLFSSLFLISYIIYHYMHGDSTFQGQGAVRYVYFFILISHIILSVFALPLVLLAFFFSLTGQIKLHKKTVRFTFPIWLYVSVTGVLVYIFLKSFP